MSEKYKANDKWPYFITFTMASWIDLFTRNCYIKVVLESLEYCVKNKNMVLHEFVVMPSHIHIIAQHHDSKLWSVIRDFKSYTAQTLYRMIKQEPTESRREWILNMLHYQANLKVQNMKYQFWQKRNRPIVLDRPEIYDQKMYYLLENPVKAGYVTELHHWLHSSAHDEHYLKCCILQEGQ